MKEEKLYYVYKTDWESFWDDEDYPFTSWSFQENNECDLKRIIISERKIEVNEARNNYTRPVLIELGAFKESDLLFKEIKHINTVIEDADDESFELRKMGSSGLKGYYKNNKGEILEELDLLKKVFKDRKLYKTQVEFANDVDLKYIL